MIQKSIHSLKRLPLFRRLAALFLAAAIGLSACGTLQADIEVPPPAGRATSTDVLLPTETVEPTPQPTPTRTPIACRASFCATPLLWIPGPGEANVVFAVPQGSSYAYDIAPTTLQLLYGTQVAQDGKGPGKIAVTNLWVQDLKTGSSRPIIEEAMVAEALFAPNGLDIAYILAKPETYELHYQTADGQDTTLARDVSFTWGFSPDGSQIAFSRESRYNIPLDPGIYGVDIQGEQQWRIADADRAGAGGSSDEPAWSPDERAILLRFYKEDPDELLLWAAIDGSESRFITPSPAVETLMGGWSLGAAYLWHPNAMQLVTTLIPPVIESALPRIVLLGIDPEAGSLTSLQIINEGYQVLVGWDVPGESVWVKNEQNQLRSIPLP